MYRTRISVSMEKVPATIAADLMEDCARHGVPKQEVESLIVQVLRVVKDFQYRARDLSSSGSDFHAKRILSVGSCRVEIVTAFKKKSPGLLSRILKLFFRKRD